MRHEPNSHKGLSPLFCVSILLQKCINFDTNELSVVMTVGTSRIGKHVVDMHTGEVVANVKSARFAKKIQEVWRSVYKYGMFTPAEEKTINRLADFLQMNTNALVNPDGSYMSIEDMARETFTNRAHIRKYIKTLMRKNALGRWSSGYFDVYYINPFLYEKGEVDEWLFHRFDQEYLGIHKMFPDTKRMRAGKKHTSLAQEKKPV